MKTIAKILSVGAMVGALALGGVVMPMDEVHAVDLEDRMNTIESNVLTMQNSAINMRSDIRAIKSEQTRIWNTLNALVEQMAAGGDNTEMNETIAGLATSLEAVNGLVETLTTRMETLGGEMVSLRVKVAEGAMSGTGSETGEAARVQSLMAEVESLAAQLVSARENELGVNAQIQSLFNQVNALRAAKMSEATGGVLAMSGTLTTSGIAKGQINEGAAKDVAKSKAESEKLTRERVEEGGEGKSAGTTTDSTEATTDIAAEEVEVPELGGANGERPQWWWMVPVMGILAFGVLLWWGIPKLAMKLGK